MSLISFIKNLVKFGTHEKERSRIKDTSEIKHFAKIVYKKV